MNKIWYKERKVNGKTNEKKRRNDWGKGTEI